MTKQEYVRRNKTADVDCVGIEMKRSITWKWMQQISTKEYKTTHNWVGKVIHWELCKKFKFSHTNKWYIHNPAAVLENKTHKVLSDFEKQTDHLISARRADLVIVKKNLPNCELCRSGGPQNKTKKAKREISTQTLLGYRKTLEHEVMVISIVTGALCTVTKRFDTGTGGLENKRTREDHPNYNIKVGQNTEKSQGDLRRLAVTQTPMRNHQLTRMGKTLKRVKQ